MRRRRRRRLTGYQRGVRRRLRGQQAAQSAAVGQDTGASGLGHQHRLGEAVLGRPGAVGPRERAEEAGARGGERAPAGLGHQRPQLLQTRGREEVYLLDYERKRTSPEGPARTAIVYTF